MKSILLAAPISDLFRNLCLDNQFNLITYEENHEIIFHDIVGIITSNKLKLDSNTLAQFSSLQWIGRIGSGMEIIDTAYCKENKISCFSSPVGISNAVAEHMMGMLLGLLHKIPFAMKDITQGNWHRDLFRGIELESLTLGIIGYGHTGSAFAKKASVFTSNILVYDKYKRNFNHDYIQEVSIEELKQQADIISFHLPQNKETINYYDANFCMSVKKPHILLNSSRGDIAPTSVILEGLAQGKIIGACLDVLSEESHIQTELQKENNLIQQLLAYPVVLTPHIAGYSFQAIEKMSDEIMQALIQHGFLVS